MADMVPFYFPGDTFTCEADGAITGCRFVAVSGARNADGNPVVAHAAGADQLGVAARDIADGEKGTVFTVGVLELEAGAAVAAGAKVTADSSGRAITATGSTGTTVAYCGKALDAAAASGDLIPVFVVHGAFVA